LVTSIDAAFLERFDWSRSDLGSPNEWPRSLRGYVDLILSLPTPAIVFWGPRQTQIYNDGYAVIMGPRHPRYFAAPYLECWPDTAPIILPWMRQVLEQGRPVEVANAPFTVTRYGFSEETYFTFTFSPLRDDAGAIAGIYQPVVESTDVVLRGRRAETLVALTRREAIAAAVEAFSANRNDVPCAAIFLVEGAHLRLDAVVGFADVAEAEARLARVRAAIDRARSENRAVEADVSIACGPWAEPVRTIVASPIRRSPGDEPLGVAVLGVSPRLRLDDGYRAFFDAVAREIGTSLAAERTLEALREADRRKDDFLAMLSHELRNPLAPIRTAIHLLDQAEPHGPSADRARAVLKRQTDHLTRIVDDLLDVTRVARGKIEIRRERMDLSQVARKTADDLRGLFVERGLSLAVKAEPGLWLDGDPTRLAQVIGNLLQNAAKFTPSGGAIALDVSGTRATVEVCVRDTGVGIDAELLPFVFDPFVQAKTPLARTQGGLGLGLALVRGVVELHEGTVTASSEGTDRGAEFRVALPRAPQPQPSPAPGAARASEERRSVLVVDDNHDAADLLAELVETFGHSAEVAYDGTDALALARARRFDVVFCDIGLPGMSGYDVARAMRASGMSGARLVAVSGYAQAEDVAAAREAGFDAHVAKPPEAERIEELLRS
jgi:signal transduction histidine kinase